MKPCTVCGWLPDLNICPGILLDLRRILGPKRRATIGGRIDNICFQCQSSAARFVGILL